eukprot:g34259.t1
MVIINLVKSAPGSVIHINQTCAVPGRTITESLVLLRDMITYMKVVSLRGVTIPGSEGLQVKASLYMDGVAVFCSDPLSVRRLMSICSHFELDLGAKVSREANIALRTINSVKETLWSTRNLFDFQIKELTSNKCCRLAHYEVQDYVLRDALKPGQLLPRCSGERTT